MLKEEKKVEYLELIYDLIFVYVIGRNSSLLRHVENGFVPGQMVLAYVLCSLAVIQIWNCSTFYINMFGRNKLRDHIALFLNMYLLYYIGEGTRVHWQSYQMQYHVAWALILINTGVQYFIERRSHANDPAAQSVCSRMMVPLFGEAAIVLLALLFAPRFGPFIAAAAICFGIVVTWALSDRSKASRVDFTHLTERAMLYVVFTFGEMIIAIASYFEGGIAPNSIYFSLMCFLIVVALFLCYGILYDRIIDRERMDNGMGYMMLHVFLLFGMNSLTTSLEFMRDEAVALWPKTIFLILSFLLFFVCLFWLQNKYSKPDLGLCRRVTMPVGILTVVFIALMLLLREYPRVNIFVSVVYVFAMFLELYLYSRPSACPIPQRGREQP
ncbi:MAG: low temperature requirement protein A [Oscillospiraceae bacterium]|nr:low temperature requirement protein A [Oscillospiraceae bacterium]